MFLFKMEKVYSTKYDSFVEWCKEGTKILHREDGPAVEWTDGSKEWFENDQLHRLDGPAREKADGLRSWYRRGKLHREDGPAIEFPNGDRYWYRDGFLHNENGPAIDCVNGYKVYYLYGNKINNKLIYNIISFFMKL